MGPDIIIGPPPVTEAEALADYVSDDGDVELNAIVNLERHLTPFDKSMEDYRIQRQAEMKRIQDEHRDETAQFCVNEANFTKGRAEEDPEEKDE